MIYEPHASHYLIPALIMGGGVLLSLVPGWGVLALFITTFIALACTSFITIAGFWGSKENYWRGLADLARTLPNLTPSEKEALRVAAPEIGYILRAGEPVLVLAETPVCPAAFFQEFLDKSNPVTTWAQRDIEKNETDSREARRHMWNDLCHYLNRIGYLVARPNGSDSWLWRAGAWRELYSKFVGSLPQLADEPTHPIANLSTVTGF